MLPAQQRLEADDLEGIEVDDRLVSKAELFFGDRFSQLGDPLETVQSCLIQLVVVEGLVRVPVRLRPVHRRVGLLQQLGSGTAQRDADARGQ